MKSASLPQHIEALSRDELVRLFPDIVHRIIVRHGLWFTEVRHQMGMEKALASLGKSFDKALSFQVDRLGKTRI